MRVSFTHRSLRVRVALVRLRLSTFTMRRTTLIAQQQPTAKGALSPGPSTSGAVQLAHDDHDDHDEAWKWPTCHLGVRSRLLLAATFDSGFDSFDCFRTVLFSPCDNSLFGAMGVLLNEDRGVAGASSGGEARAHPLAGSDGGAAAAAGSEGVYGTRKTLVNL